MTNLFRSSNHARFQCFILVLPKPVQAAIRGGPYREVGVEQQLILDGSTSRDFAIAPDVEQALLYRWDCVNLEGDPQTGFCRSNISTGEIFQLILSQHYLRSAECTFRSYSRNWPDTSETWCSL